MFARRFLTVLLLFANRSANSQNLQRNFECISESKFTTGQVTLNPPSTSNNSRTTPTVFGVQYTFSKFACAILCQQNSANNGCVGVQYDEITKSCTMYKLTQAVQQQNQTAFLPDNVTCWSQGTLVNSPDSSPSTNTTSQPVTETLSTNCSASAEIIANPTRNSTNCGSLLTCICNATLDTPALTSTVPNASTCFTTCAENSNCSSFSYNAESCSLATGPTQMAVINASQAYTCRCKKASTTANNSSAATGVPNLTTTAMSVTKIVVLNGTTYSNLSCYPNKLLNGLMKVPGFDIDQKKADCDCWTGPFMVINAYVETNATDLISCFRACTKVLPVPCQAFALIENNNTCILSPGLQFGNTLGGQSFLMCKY